MMVDYISLIVATEKLRSYKNYKFTDSNALNAVLSLATFCCSRPDLNIEAA